MGNNGNDGSSPKSEDGGKAESGDLSEWEYLTKVYDHGDMLDDDHLQITDLEVSTHQHHSTAPSKRMKTSLKRDRVQIENSTLLQNLKMKHNPKHNTLPAARTQSLRKIQQIEALSAVGIEANMEHQHSKMQASINDVHQTFQVKDDNQKLPSIPSTGTPDANYGDSKLLPTRSWTHPTLSNLYKLAIDNSTTIPSYNLPNSLITFPAEVSSGDAVSRQSMALRNEMIKNQYASILSETKASSCNVDSGTSFEPWVTQIGVKPIQPRPGHHDRPRTSLISSMVEQPDISTLKRKSENDAITDSHRNVAIQSFRTDVTISDATSVNPETSTDTVKTIAHGNQHVIPYTLIPKFPITPPYQQLNDKSLLLKPLTPYNYYYRDERDNIVMHLSDTNNDLPSPVKDFSTSKMQSLLDQHWYIDPFKNKRIHRKTHGKISFQQLSKIISERWRNLPHHGREFYRVVARHDEMYYHQNVIKILENERNIDPSSNTQTIGNNFEQQTYENVEATFDYTDLPKSDILDESNNTSTSSR